jgi:hypothetical protein
MSLAPKSDYGLTVVNDELDNEIYSDKQSNLHGEIYVSNSAGIRKITIKGIYNVYSGGMNMKRQMERVFNLTVSGTLIYKHKLTRVERWIECYIDSKPEITLDGKDLRFNIELSCLKPFWRGAGMSGTISSIYKAGKFPLIIPPEKFIFGYRLHTFENIVDNYGDVESGITFKIRAMDGTVTNPSITHKDTGSVIKVFKFLDQGDELDIICAPDRALVLYNGEDGMRYLTDDAKRKFFTLLLGSNIIGYDADENPGNMEVSFSSDDLYIGV